MKIRAKNSTKNDHGNRKSLSKGLAEARIISFAFLVALMMVFPVYIFAQQTSTSQTPAQLAADANYRPDQSKIIAKNVLVTNLTTGQVLFDKNSTVVQPIASLAKLMTAITIKEIQATWKNPPEKIKLISKTAAYTKADFQVATGGYMKTNDLVSYMLLASSNFAAQSLANGVMPYTSFISYMNFTAKNLGLNSYAFVNASGLTEANGKSSIGSAQDIMKTLVIIMKKYPELASATRSNGATIKSSTGEVIEIDNTNKSLDVIPGIVLGKTGFTDEAGGNLALVIKRNNNYYGVVVMGSTIDARFTDAEYLASLIPVN